MPINPNIALSAKGVEIQDPLAAYGKIAQIQGYQQQNALNQMKMQESRDALAQRNALNMAYQGAYDPATQSVNENKLLGSLASGGFGSQIPGIQKGLQEAKTAKVTYQKGQMGLIKDKLELVKPLYQQALNSANPGAAMLEIHSAVHADPELGPWLNSMGATADRGQQDLMAAITQGPEAVRQKIFGSIASVEKLLPTLTSTGTGGGTELGTRDQLTGAYTPGATIAKTPLPPDVLAQDLEKGRASATKVTVGPEQKSLAGPIADIAKASHDKAQSAPSMMITANSVREALNSGNVIAGVLADPRRKLAQIMELAGAGDKEKLVNTRIAIQGLAGLTLESRTELKGQGQVTENEQKLLERARSASVDELTIPELQQVVNISQRLATRMRSNHDVLLGRMAKDPNAQSTIDYYRPTEQMPEPVLEARQDTKKDAQQQKQLEGIFGKKPGE